MFWSANHCFSSYTECLKSTNNWRAPMWVALRHCLSRQWKWGCLALELVQHFQNSNEPFCKMSVKSSTQYFFVFWPTYRMAENFQKFEISVIFPPGKLEWIFIQFCLASEEYMWHLSVSGVKCKILFNRVSLIIYWIKLEQIHFLLLIQTCSFISITWLQIFFKDLHPQTWRIIGLTHVA